MFGKVVKKGKILRNFKVCRTEMVYLCSQIKIVYFQTVKKRGYYNCYLYLSLLLPGARLGGIRTGSDGRCRPCHIDLCFGLQPTTPLLM